ncbi:MAG: 50S ribosomal protein L21 [Patescibacteria group bacterium]|nr:50S ribosomal protein L21 [Patescibacteria group bacterium]
MQFAIIETGGHQYRVAVGMKLQLEKIDNEINSKVIFNDVLLVADGDNLTIGQPLVSDASVEAKILYQGRDKKINIIKKIPKKRRESKRGHRQSFTEVEITKINFNGGKKQVSEKVSIPEEKTLAKKTKVVVKVEKPVKKAREVAKKPKATAKKVAATKKIAKK